MASIFYKLRIEFYVFYDEQIVTLGMPTVSPIKRVGTYVNPKDWNALISDPDTVSATKFNNLNRSWTQTAFDFSVIFPFCKYY